LCELKCSAVYNGFGNSNCYLPFVSKLFEYVHVEYVNNLDFLKNKTHSPNDILYIGGGRGKYVLENISGTELKENLDQAKIRYIGVCCGAYLAGKHIFFDDVKKGTLGLCDVVSVGPYYKKGHLNYDYSVDNSTVISSQLLREKSETKVNTYLNGGGWFSNVPKDFEVVSCYENSSLPNTIMNNRMFLSHIHIEHPSTNRIYSNILHSFMFT
jgi:glutamine amidotransferase-like uncharacterized protein